MRIEEAASSILEIQVQNCNSDPHRIAQESEVTAS
jgi:hypothetical protein